MADALVASDESIGPTTHQHHRCLMNDPGATYDVCGAGCTQTRQGGLRGADSSGGRAATSRGFRIESRTQRARSLGPEQCRSFQQTPQ